MYNRTIIDNHVHLDFYTGEEVKRICEGSFELYSVATHYKSALKLLTIKKEYKNVKIAFGIHPEYFDNYKDFDKIKELIYEHKDDIYAIGEVGLPYFYLEKLSPTKREEVINKGEELFINFVKIAVDLDKPLQIHGTGTSTKRVLEILHKYKCKKALFHWLNTDLDLHKKLIDLGYYYSISLDYLYNESYREYINMLPLKNFLLESDGPWSYDGKNKSYPSEIIKLAEKLANDRGLNIDTIIDLNNGYNKKIFGG